MKYLTMIVAFLALTACTTQYGNKFDADKAASFKIGKTTYSEVVEALGEPVSVNEGSDGTKSISYSYIQSKTDAKAHIPFVNMFADAPKTESHSASYVFDKHSILVNKSVSNQNLTSKSSSPLTQAAGK